MSHPRQAGVKISEIAREMMVTYAGPDVLIHGLNYADATSSHESIMTYAASRRYLISAINNQAVKAIVTTKDLVSSIDSTSRERYSFILSPDPISFFYKAYNVFYARFAPGRSEVKQNEIGRGCKIHDSAVIESNVSIGNNVNIGPNAVIIRGSVIEDNVTIGANTVIGADGFEHKMIDGKLQHIPHAGGVFIGRSTWIGSNTFISASLFEGFTKIGPYAKIDNAVHISHNVSVGANSVICANACVAGSARIGNYVFIGVGALLNNRISIGDHARINMGAVVVESVPCGSNYSGFYAVPSREWHLRSIADRRAHGF